MNLEMIKDQKLGDMKKSIKEEVYKLIADYDKNQPPVGDAHKLQRGGSHRCVGSYFSPMTSYE